MGRNIGWNSAASVAVDGELAFVGGGGPGQSLLGLNKRTGRTVVWKGYDEIITHSTPVVATIHGSAAGNLLPQERPAFVVHEGRESALAFPVQVQHVVRDFPGRFRQYRLLLGRLRHRRRRVQITRVGDDFTAKVLWVIPGNQLVANHWSTPVCKDGHLYGMFCFKKFKTGPLKCVELATGKIEWEKPGFGQGNVILVGDRLLALADDGQLVVVEATPTAYKEIARTKAVEGKCWSTPAFSDGRIYVHTQGKARALT